MDQAMDRHKDRLSSVRHKDRQTDGQMKGWTDIRTAGQKDRQTHRKHRQVDR